MSKNPHAVALGRLGGKTGKGQAKARTTPEQIEARRKGQLRYWSSEAAKARRKAPKAKETTQ